MVGCLLQPGPELTSPKGICSGMVLPVEVRVGVGEGLLAAATATTATASVVAAALARVAGTGREGLKAQDWLVSHPHDLQAGKQTR